MFDDNEFDQAYQETQQPTKPPATAPSEDDEFDKLYKAQSDPKAAIDYYSQKYNVDPEFAHRIAQQESGYNQSAVSPKGARGVMQLMPGTAKTLGVNPNKMSDNVEGGVKYLRQLLDKHNGDQRLAAADYNSGAVDKYGGVPPYKETQDYVAKTAGDDDFDKAYQASQQDDFDKVYQQTYGQPAVAPSTDPKFGGAIAQQQAKPAPVAPQPNVPSYQQVTPDLINKALNKPFDAQAATEFAQRNQVADALQGFVDKQDRMNNLMAKQSQAARVQGNPRGAALGTVPRTTMTPAESQELQGLQGERDTLIERARQKAESERPDDLMSVAKANGTAQEAALGAFVQKHGALTRDEQKLLGLPTNYLTNLSINAATGFAQFGANTAAGFERLVGSPANARDLQRMSQQMGVAEGVFGNPDLPGAIAHSVGALAPQMALSTVLPESALADPLFFAGSTALEHYGQGASGVDALAAGAGALTPIAGAKIIGGLAAGGPIAQTAQRVLGNAAANSLIAAAQGGDRNAIITAGLMGAFMGVGGENEPIDPDVIKRAVSDDGLRAAVIEHAKNPSAETFDNVAKTAEKAGLDAYEAQKFATNVDSLKSASAGAQENLPNTQESTTTPESPAKPGELAGTEQVKPEDLQRAAPVVTPNNEQSERQTATVENAEKQPWQMTRDEFYNSGNVGYHGGADVGPDGILKRGYQGGAKTGQDMGGIFFTEDPQYAEGYKKQDGAVYEHLHNNENIFDASNPEHLARLKDGFLKDWEEEYGSKEDALQDYQNAVRSIKATMQHGAADWATASGYTDQIEKAGFDGARFLERPGTIAGTEKGFEVSGKPIYSVGVFRDTPVSRNLHHDMVADALREGKPVPPEVLADYPDLQKKAEPVVAGTKAPVTEAKPVEPGTITPEKVAKPEEFGASNKKFTKSGVENPSNKLGASEVRDRRVSSGGVRDTASTERDSEISRGSAKFFRSPQDAKTFDEQGLGGLDVPGQGLVLSRVIAALHQPEIRDSVIKRVPVDVVDDLVRRQLSTDVGLHDGGMLIYGPSGDLKNSISLRVDVANSLVRAVARAATELSEPLGNRNIEDNAAVRAGDAFTPLSFPDQHGAPRGTGNPPNGSTISSGNGDIEKGSAISAGDFHESNVSRNVALRQPNSEDQANESTTNYSKTQPDFDHEVKTISDALSDPEHPFAQAVDRVAGGDTSPEAIDAIRAAGKEFDPATVDDAIDGATRVANKQPTESAPPRSSETPPAETGVGESGQAVGIKNAVTDRELAEQGKPKIDTSDQKRSFDQVVEAGKAAVDDGRINPGQLAERIAAKPRPLTPEETAALLFHKTQLLNHEDSIMKELRGHRETGDVDSEIDARARLQTVQEQLDTARVASRKSGYEQGLGLAIRRAMMERDYSLSRMIDRAEAANKGKPLSDAQKVDLEKLRDTIMQREEQYKDYDERQSKGEASKTITELRKEASAERKAGRTVKRSTLDGEFASQKNALAKLFSRDPNGPGKGLGGREAGAVDPELLGLPVEALKILRDMARNRLEAGLTSVDGVVDSIHEAVADVMGGVTKRQIRDLISGYGKTSKPNPEALAAAMRELTAGMRDVSAEEDILGGKAPERSGYQRGPMTPEARARRQRINQLMREHGIEIERSGRSPEEQQKSALDGVKTRLKNAIEDLQRQIDTGEKPSKRTPVPRDEEARALQAKRDDLARTLQDINGPRKMTDAQRLDMAKGAARKAIDEYQRRIDQKDFATKQSGKVSDPELDALKAKRDALKTDYQKLADADPAVQAKRDAAKLDQLKTRMQKRLDSLKQQVATGNFYRNAQGKLTTSKPRVPFAGLDPEAQEIKANVEKAQSAADAKIKAIELANRSAPEKIMDGLAKIRRFIVLSSGTAVEKLTAAGATRQISDPIEAGIGGAISKTPGLRDIAAKAPREGAFKPSVEAQASALYIKKMLDLSRFKETLKTGKGKLDLIHGGKEYFDSDSKTDRILGFYNRLHATLKEPVKEAEFFRSTQYRTDQAIRQGMDITDPKVRDNIAAQAYLDANRKVFMNPNFVTDAYTGAINKLQSSERLDAKAMATVMKVLFPVVRVPTNYLAETSSYSPIGFAKAGTTLLRKGIKDLKPEDADYVMRNLKKGLIGTAAMGIGAGLSQNFGGFYTQGNYSTPQDMKAGEIKIFGVNVPRLFLHHPLIEAMQFGATFAHLHGDKQEGKLSSLFDTSLALSEEQPFIGETIRNVEAVTDKTKRAPAAGQLVGGLVTPPDLRRIANILDPKTPTSVMMKLLQTGGLQSADPMYRPAKTFAQGFESGIPSFIPYVNRKNIPSKLIPPSRPVRPEKPSR